MSELSLTQQSNTKSPFDSIRRFDEQGNEFWNARELQKLLGYAKWQHFAKNIRKAIIACKNSGNLDTEHFLPRSVKSSTKSREDWILSRYACHLAAMNGDPEKPQIAAAQSYFSVKTREAEITIPALEGELELQKLRNEELELQLKLQQSQLALGQFRHNVVTMLPEHAQQKILGYQEVVKIEEREVHITPEGDRSEGLGITAIARRYGFKSTKKAWEWLEQIGLGRNAPQWASETRGVTSRVLPMDYLADLDNAWDLGDGRDRFIGE